MNHQLQLPIYDAGAPHSSIYQYRKLFAFIFQVNSKVDLKHETRFHQSTTSRTVSLWVLMQHLVTHMVKQNIQGSNFQQQVDLLPSASLLYSLEPVKVCIIIKTHQVRPSYGKPLLECKCSTCMTYTFNEITSIGISIEGFVACQICFDLSCNFFANSIINGYRSNLMARSSS